MIEIITRPWPWYVSGPLAGLMVPLLLLLGNKSFGLSSSLRHICASCLPAHIPFFKYEWKKEIWNLVLVSGILIGGFIAGHFMMNNDPVLVSPQLTSELAAYGIDDFSHLVPAQLMNWHALFSLRGFVLMVAGGFLTGFGTRYAGGCTSGHSIMGLSALQWPSLVATICFMAGGFIMANLLLPLILSL